MGVPGALQIVESSAAAMEIVNHSISQKRPEYVNSTHTRSSN